MLCCLRSFGLICEEACFSRMIESLSNWNSIVLG
jgi:hypothetical protein